MNRCDTGSQWNDYTRWQNDLATLLGQVAGHDGVAVVKSRASILHAAVVSLAGRPAGAHVARSVRVHVKILRDVSRVAVKLHVPPGESQEVLTTTELTADTCSPLTVVCISAAL